MGEVDFDKIFNVKQADYSRLQRVSGGNDVIIPLQGKNRPEVATEAQNDIAEAQTRMKREVERRKLERERYQQGITTQQEAVRKAGTLRNDILKGIHGGADPIGLLLKACECIAKQIGEELFFTQARDDIRAIYGYALGEAGPLQQELLDTKGRLEKLEQAEAQEPDERNRRRIQTAIREHRKQIERIENKLNN